MGTTRYLDKDLKEFKSIIEDKIEKAKHDLALIKSAYMNDGNNGTEDTISLPHDIVLIKFCQIDEPALRFWRGVVRQFATNGNPFAEPMNLVSNINGGLGAFTGYGAIYYKVPIIKNTTIIDTIQPNIIDIF